MISSCSQFLNICFLFVTEITNTVLTYLRTFERHGKSVNLVLVGAYVLAENLGLEERRLRHLVPIGEQLRNLSIGSTSLKFSS